MKPLLPPLASCLRQAAVLAFLLPTLTSGALGQVAVDMHALDAVGPAQPHPPPVRRPAQLRPPAHHTTAAASHRPAAASVAQDNPPAAKPAPVPAATVPVPTLPSQQPAPPPASTIVPAPATNPLPLPSPVRLVFQPGKADLTPGDAAEVEKLARSLPAPASDSVNVVAYAAGQTDDPSTPRRLSLSRGLAVRSVLLASGVPSDQIYVRALGATPSDGPADRVDLTVAPIGTVTR